MELNEKLLKKIESQLKVDIKSHKLLGTGEHNFNYLLKTDQDDFVLRIYANTQFDNSEKEYKILSLLNGKFAPKAILLDDSKRIIPYNYMIQEFVDGVQLDAFSDEDLKKIAQILKEFHQITDESKKREWKNPIDEWTKNNILENSKQLGAEFHKQMKELYSKIDNEVQDLKLLITKYDRIHLVHNDVIPENVMKLKDNSLILLDWEFASFNYFFLDLGCLIVESELTKEQEKLVLKEYGFGLNNDEKKIVYVTKLLRALSLIGWLIERITSTKETFAKEDKKKYQIKLKKNLDYINDLFI